MPKDILTRLQTVQNDVEREQILLDYTLESKEPEFQVVIFAAAIPHWFDMSFLSVLLEIDSSRAESWLEQLKTLSFVEIYPIRGYAVHERTRKSLLKRVWEQDRPLYQTLSKRALDHCIAQLHFGFAWVMEAIYHLSIAKPDEGASALCSVGWIWQNSPHYWYSRVEMLANLTAEHMAAGRLNGRSSGWTLYWQAHISHHYSKDVKAKEFLNAISPAWLDEDQYLKACDFALTGNVNLLLAEFTQARECHEEARPIFHELGDRLGEANCILALGEVHQHLAEYTLAREQYEEAQTIYHEIGALRGEANCIQSMGDIHLWLAEYAQARKRYEEAQPIFHEIGDQLGEANCTRGLGDVHLKLAEYAQAQERFEEAWLVFDEIGVRLGKANCVRGLGDVHLTLAEYAQARKRFDEARLVYHEIGARRDEANCILRLGDVAKEENDWQLSEQMYREALNMALSLDLTLNQASALNSLAGLYERQKNYEKALEIFSQAIECFPQEAMYYRNRASVLMSLREIPRAKEDLNKAHDLQPEHPYLDLSLGNLAVLNGKYPEAITSFQTAIQKIPHFKTAWFGIGRARLLQGDLDAAHQAYQQGLKFADAPGELSSEIYELEQLCKEHPHRVEQIEMILQMLRDYTPTPSK